jgi:S1-C subfamily serine protease
LNALEVPTKGGIQIQSVESGGPADKAGLRSGDIILQFEGKPVDTIDALHKVLDESSIGRSITLWVLRDGQLKSLVAVPVEMK